MRGRVVRVLLVTALLVGAFWWATELGPLRGCRGIAPRELPSGSAPGQGVEGVSGGAKQVVWGSGQDRVEQIVGISYYDGLATLVRDTGVREHQATLYRLGEDQDGLDLAISWTEDDCSYTVFLAPGTTVESATSFASGY